MLEEVLDSSNAYQAMCLVYIALELLKRDPSPVNPFLSPLCLVRASSASDGTSGFLKFACRVSSVLSARVLEAPVLGAGTRSAQGDCW